MKQLGNFYSPLDEMLVYCSVIQSIKFTGDNLYTWVEGGTVRGKCISREHNTMSLVRAHTGQALRVRPREDQADVTHATSLISLKLSQMIKVIKLFKSPK